MGVGGWGTHALAVTPVPSGYCSAEQCRAMQCTYLHCTAVQCSVMFVSVVQAGVKFSQALSE